jgi:amino acid adenylation domain-containing protein
MERHEVSSAIFVGEGTLLVRCAEIFLEAGHQIHGIVSFNPLIKRWAEENVIPHVDPADDVVGFMSRTIFDYLFSVVNPSVLPGEVLALPRKLGVNFHDALLPKYAGSYATTWALINGEQTHGVTWHEMIARVDAGRILKQRVVEISEHETAFSLNGKCYEAGIQSFAELTADISSGRLAPSDPRLDERTYFSKYKRPYCAAVISWDRPAEEIESLVRALTFGSYRNPLGLAKIYLGEEAVIVQEIGVLDAPSRMAAPGTVTSIGEDGVRVVTGSRDIVLRTLLTIDGQPLPVAEFERRFDVRVGQRLPKIGREQAEWLTTLNNNLARHEEFWVRTLSRLESIDLPYAHRAVSSTGQARHVTTPVTVPTDLATMTARLPGWNVGDLLIAAFAAYLARLGGKREFDLGFGEPALRRELAGLQGLFATQVPLHVNLGQESSISEALQTVLDAIALVRAHKTYVRDVVGRYPELSSLSMQGGQPRFSIIAEYVEDLDSYELRPGGELALIVAPDRSASRWLYNPDIFAAEDVALMQHQFAQVLQGVVKDRGGSLGELPLLSDEERLRILVEWNDTKTDYPKDRCVHELFEEQVERTPDAVAVVFEDEELTYRELNRRANQLAHHLQRLGIGPEVLVGICVERSVEMVVGLLGILKAGGAYVPLDPAYPEERLAWMLRDARVGALLTQGRLRERPPASQVQVVCLDAGWGPIAQQSEENPASMATTEDLAYTIYTSGSTGRPKGVQVSHRNVVNLFEATRPSFGFDERDVWTVSHSYAFDFSAWEIWGALLHGGRLVVVPRQVTQSPAEFYDLLKKEGVTVLNQTPSALRQLVQVKQQKEEQAADAAEELSLRLIVCGGEAFPTELASRLLKWDVPVWNFYGPTEATVWSTAHRVSPGAGSVPLGRPLANTRAYVLDPRLQPVPIGIPDELYIGGPGVTRGYLNRPELTAERFIPDPFGDEPGARLYKTGDLARYLPDGNIEFLGRLDHQVKVRGFRVEPGEVKAALMEHLEVREAVVVAREDETGDKRLVAYCVVLTEQQEPTTSELRSFLKQKLPEHMVPAAFVMLEALPLTPNGKVDRHALPMPDRTRPELDRIFVPPRSPVEQTVAGTWSEVLGLERVGVHDNFLELGGHSLLATQVIARLCGALGIELPVSSLFESPTVAGLAEKIHLTASDERVPPIRPVPRGGDLPVSFSQEWVWFLQQLAPENLAYNFQATLRFVGPLDIAALERSLGEIVCRHEIFRTTFPAVEGRPVQRIHDPGPVDLPVLDVQAAPESEREAEARRLIGRELQRPFDLTRLPLVRWTLIRLAPREHVLVHVEHHLVHDGWSFNVFLRELRELYGAFSVGKPSPLRELPIQFADFAVWQRRWMQEEGVAEAQLAYWKEKLAGSPPVLELPTDRPRPAVQTFRGAAPRVELPLDLCEALRAVSRRDGVTLFMTMLAAFLTLLYRYTEQEDICVGTGIANRRWRETEELIGMIINTVTLRTDLSGDPTFRELLGRVREVTLEAYAHQDLPFGKVVEALRPERSLSYSPLHQVLFSFHDAPMPDLNFPGMDTSLREVLSNGSAKFDLNVIAIPRSEQRVGPSRTAGADGITLIWEYSTDLFDDTTMDRMVGHYRTLLESIVADPDRRLSGLPLLIETERHRLLVEWNDTTTKYPRDRCVHELFEEQVQRTPDAVAVIGDERLTYRELNRRANRLAHHLRKLGVGPEVLVGICVERSVEMVVGLLGILKAGGAYVPLNPAYPKERLSFMIEETQAPVLLTQRRLAKGLPEHGARVVCLDADWPVIARESEENLDSGAKADNLAYVTYTSGSTGVPKGVMVEHRPVVRLTKNTNYLQFRPDDVFLQLAPLTFDASTLEIWGPLLNGGRLTLASPGRLGLAELAATIRRHGVTTLWLTAGLFHQLIDAEPAALSGVRNLLAGGDILSPTHVRKALHHLPKVCLINGYGPTENTTFTCCLPTSAAASPPEGSIPLGKPISNTRVYILDAHLRPVPIGVVGELYAGGEGLARGYLSRPELTAEKFIPDLFSDEPGARLYRSGDLARYLPDGNIEFLGRIDHQVKIRGFRVEPGEVEAVLGQHPEVREAVVMTREDALGEKQLVTYIVPARKRAPKGGELRGHLKEKLPEYMVPTAFVTLEALPLTPNGKVDRRALPAPDPSSFRAENAYAEPRTPVEEALAGIWEEVLDVGRVGIHDDFFELGGHSLLATQLVSRVREAFQVELPLRSLFEEPTIAGLAVTITQQRQGEKADPQEIRIPKR